MGAIICSAKEAVKIMEHMNENDVVILSVIDKKSHVYDVPKRIKKKKGEDLIRQANNIQYQDNDFFGMLSLYGVLKDKDSIIHNILFPQLE